jgi:hypothetical protein
MYKGAMMILPKIKNYGTGEGNTILVDLGAIDLYFSYQTVVAFQYKGKLVIRENDWGCTTGKHLNWINEDKSIRIDGETFENQLSEIMEAL